MPQQTIHKEPEQEKPKAAARKPEQVRQRNVAGNADSTSLVEALQALVLEMSGIESDAEAVKGLKRLREIRNGFLGSGAGSDPARRDAEALIAWVETRLEQLRQLLARKRRIQEGMVMEQIAKQREAEGPSLLPTELIEAVVHSTDAKDPEAVKTSAPPSPRQEQKEAEQAPKKPKPAPAKKPEPTEEKTAREPQASAQPAEPEKPAEAKSAEVKPAEVKPAEAKPAEVKPAEVKPAEVQAAQAQKPEWSRFERLAAHMAAMSREDPKFFDKLRKAAKSPGLKMRAPEDNGVAERHYRTVHDLNKRLVNLELHSNALAAGKPNERQLPLLKTAAREIKHFLLDLKAGKERQPEMAPELDRLFGGWAEQFSQMKAEKGQEILARCQAERQPERREAQRQARNPEPEAPQLVLRRREDWEH